MDTNIHKYPLISALVFGLVGIASLLFTDAAFIPRAPDAQITFYFSSQPTLLASVSLLPAFFAYFACYRWLVKGSKILNSWLAVAIFSGLSLAINPIVWMLILISFFFYGLVVFCMFILTGLILKFILGNMEHGAHTYKAMHEETQCSAPFCDFAALNSFTKSRSTLGSRDGGVAEGVSQIKKLYLGIFLPLFLFTSLNSFGSDKNIHVNVRYSKNVDIRLSEDPETPNIVEDFIEIGQNKEGSVVFKFWLNQSNGHVCRLSGESKIINGNHLIYSEYMKYIETTCILKIYETSHSIVIDDVDGECRKNYCGARGGIGKTSLPLSSKKLLSSPVNINSW